jgi:hypothetical protein
MTDVSALILGMNKSRQQEDSIKLANRFKMEEGCCYIGTLLMSDANLWSMLVLKNLRLGVCCVDLFGSQWGGRVELGYTWLYDWWLCMQEISPGLSQMVVTLPSNTSVTWQYLKR